MKHCKNCKKVLTAHIHEITPKDKFAAITNESLADGYCKKCHESQSSHKAKTGEERRMKQKDLENYEFNEAEAGEVFPFEKPGDNITGKVIGIRKGTYGNVYDIETPEGNKTVFGSTVIDGKITADKMDAIVRIEFLGMATGIKSGREYKNFKISFGTPKA